MYSIVLERIMKEIVEPDSDKFKNGYKMTCIYK